MGSYHRVESWNGKDVTFEVWFDTPSRCWWWHVCKDGTARGDGQPFGPFVRREEALEDANKFTH